MKNVYEVLRQKESQLGQTRIEVEALRLVVPLLGEDEERATEVFAENVPKANQR